MQKKPSCKGKKRKRRRVCLYAVPSGWAKKRHRYARSWAHHPPPGAEAQDGEQASSSTAVSHRHLTVHIQQHMPSGPMSEVERDAQVIKNAPAMDNSRDV